METVYLMGSEDVQRAGSSIRGSADDIRSAASQISEALDRHRIGMSELVSTMVEMLDALRALNLDQR